MKETISPGDPVEKKVSLSPEEHDEYMSELQGWAEKLEFEEAPELSIAEVNNTLLDLMEDEEDIESLESILTEAYDYGVYASLEKGNYSTKELATFVAASKMVCDKVQNTILQERQKWHAQLPTLSEITTSERKYEQQYTQLLALLEMVPPDKLRALYVSDELSSDFKSVMSQSRTFEEIEKSTYLLCQIYELEQKLDLVTMQKTDPIVATLADAPLMPKVLTSELKELTSLDARNTPQADNTVKRDWGDRFLGEYAGMSEALRDRLQFVSYSRTCAMASERIDTTRYKEMLQKAALVARQLGNEKLEALHVQAGITNFDYYEPDQLELTAKALAGDPDTLAHLQAGDVTVVFTDATGDDNGALGTVGRDFKTTSGRTLFFEITQPSDFYRFAVRLRALGIKPSTVSINVHGEPGEMIFGDEKQRFTLNNSETPSVKDGWNDTSLLSARDLCRKLAEEFMQDSRGIDDNAEAIGRRRVIIGSCYQAAPTEENGPSTAYSLTQALGGEKYDVYAGDRPLQVAPTDKGLVFTASEDKEGNSYPFGQSRVFPITKYRLNSKGVPEEVQVDEIVLYSRSREHRGEQ